MEVKTFYFLAVNTIFITVKLDMRVHGDLFAFEVSF